MNYYNEHDPRAAQWLRELIKGGHIPAGDVDERDIQTVKAHELTAYTQCHFFAGIGGWSLALRLAGWPESKPVWTGSCPCQPFSVSGEGMGEADERHLWPDFRNLIGQCGPPVVFGEQVASKLGRKWLAGVSADMEALAYRCAAADLCAAGVGAPHRRQRLYWVADPARQQRIERVSLPGGEPREANPDTSVAGVTGRLSDTQHSYRGTEQQPRESQPDGRPGPSGSGEARGVADTESGGLGVNGRASRQPGHPDECQPTCGMVFSGKPRLEGHAWNGDDRSEPGRLDAESNGSTSETGGAGAKGVDNSTSARFESTRKGTEIETRDEARLRGPQCGCSGGHWDRFDILPFRDGKFRRVEAGTFPLASRLPVGVVPSGDPSLEEAQASSEKRVARLRGYGNAIVPQLAAEFIKAAMEATNAI